ncbi:STAS domain-containing protein [Blastococcus sp. SYSU DS0619]
MRVHVQLNDSSVAGAHDVTPSPPSFQAVVDGPRVALTGDVDALGVERLGRVLAASPVDGGTCALDLSGLRFADVAGCRAIARWARTRTERGIDVELRNAPPLVQRAWHLLALDEWAPVSFTEAG